MAYKFNPFSGTLDYYQPANPSDVTGIAPTDINAITRWADVNGTQIKNSPNTYVQDSGAIEAQAFITKAKITGDIAIHADEVWIAPALELTLTGSVVIDPDGEIVIVE